MSIIDKIRQEREDLARVLKEYSGLRKTVEDLYPDTAHFIFELLQNAEDTRASEATFVLFQDKLVFEHNGRPFDEADIRGITNIGEGTKTKDENKIGYFGIGFKAVFNYTEMPYIYSPTYSFKISDMVRPFELPQDSKINDRTKFKFPFNSNKTSSRQAFLEIQNELKKMPSNTLLFLSHIKEIRWRIADDQEQRLIRIQHSDHHIEICRKTNDKLVESSHFLHFNKPVTGIDIQHIAIAFELKSLSGDILPGAPTPLFKRFRIVPADRGCVAVYFPATKETSNLCFHLHAPFIPELSRSSIKDISLNEMLVGQLAKLAVQALFKIRELKLLDRNFLAVLPNSQDKIIAPYTSIRNAIVDAMNNRSLTPKHGGDGYAPAKKLLQAEAGLKNLLNCNDLRFLRDDHDELRNDWAISVMRRNSRIDRFLHDLDIEQWGVAELVETLRLSLRGAFPGWMRQKPIEWHRALYALLHQELTEYELNLFDNVCIVRCSDGEYRAGGDCYFPTPEIREDSIHPRVVENTFTGGRSKTEQKSARAFLEGIKVREVGEPERIRTILDARYADYAHATEWKIYQSDLKRFIALVEKNEEEKYLFQDYFIFQGADRSWHRPASIYLDAPYQDTGLHAYYKSLESKLGCVALSGSYKNLAIYDSFIKFARICGVIDHLKIEPVNCDNNPAREYLRRAPGSIRTEREEDRDFVIPYLEELFKNPNLELSRLIWRSLCDRSDEEIILQAKYQRNQSHFPHIAESQLVHHLRDSKWVPQENGTFVRPAEALRDFLPKDFPFDPGWSWLAAIHFGEETEKGIEQQRRSLEMALEIGFSDEDALRDAKQFAGLPPNIRQKILAEQEGFVDLSKGEEKNRKRRAELVRKDARQAPKRDTEKRVRSVSIHHDIIKKEKTDPYLRELYTYDDGVTICQICKYRLPFKLDNGNYFFEKVEFLRDLEKEHYQNYLILCPNHAAMFKFANSSEDELKAGFLSLNGNELIIILAGQPVVIHFEKTHIEDIRIAIEEDGM